MAQDQSNLDEEIVDLHSLAKPTTEDILKRLKIRQGYRQLIIKVENNKEELLRQECGDLLGHKIQADELFNQLPRRSVNTKEVAMDARFMVLATSLAVQKANQIQTNLIEFRPDEFIEKLVTKMDGRYVGETRDEIQVTSESWRFLGRYVSEYFVSIPPAVSVLSGTFKTESKLPPPPPPPPDVVKNQPTDKDAAPQTVTRLKEGKEATTEELERIYEIINNLYKDDPVPIDYFELVVNPYSFGHTIENIFHVSFLVRDGHIQILLNEDSKLPEVIPLNKNEDENGNCSQVGGGSNQAVVSLSMNDWREIVAIYQLKGKAPLIEPLKRIHPVESVDSMDTS